MKPHLSHTINFAGWEADLTWQRSKLVSTQPSSYEDQRNWIEGLCDIVLGKPLRFPKRRRTDPAQPVHPKAA